MSFTPKDWKDLPDVTTPLSAAALEDLEVRVTDYADEVAAEAQLNATNYTGARETAIRTDLTDDLSLYADQAAQQAELNANSYTDSVVGGGGSPALAKYIATAQQITSTTYVKATTADEVTGLVTDNDYGILEVGFRALWRESSMDAFARAAIFVNDTQLQTLRGYTSLSPGNQAGCFPGGSTSNNDMPLITFPIGLCSFNTSGGIGSATLPASFSTPLALGMQWGLGHSGPTWTDDDTNRRMTYDNMAGGPFWAGGGTVKIPVPAGTHSVDIRYKVNATYNCTVKERRLWVRVLEHAEA